MHIDKIQILFDTNNFELDSEFNHRSRKTKSSTKRRHLFVQKKKIRCEIQFCASGIYRLPKMCGRMRIHGDRWAMNAWVDGGYPYGCEDGWGMDGEWGINSKVSN